VANLRSRAENFSRERAAGFRLEFSSSSNIDIRASTSSVGIIQSIGME